MSEEKKNTISLEEHFANLDQILCEMESDVSLDEAFALYRKGMEEIKEANESLDAVEKAMKILTADGSIEDF